MVKTAVIEDDVHELLLNKLREIKEKRGYAPNITHIVNNILRKNIDEIE